MPEVSGHHWPCTDSLIGTFIYKSILLLSLYICGYISPRTGNYWCCWNDTLSICPSDSHWIFGYQVFVFRLCSLKPTANRCSLSWRVRTQTQLDFVIASLARPVSSSLLTIWFCEPLAYVLFYVLLHLLYVVWKRHCCYLDPSSLAKGIFWSQWNLPGKI